MNNQIIFWLVIIVPWFSLFFMKRLEMKWYFPVALLTAITSLLIVHIGSQLDWWYIKETVYPLGVSAEVLGILPVLMMWIMKYTFKRFWLYLAVNITLNLAYSFLYFGYLATMAAIIEYVTITPWFVLIVTTAQGLLLYVFQLWMDGALIHPKKEVEDIPASEIPPKV